MTETKNLSAQTPREIDEQLAALDRAYGLLEHAHTGALSFLHSLDDQRMRYVGNTKTREWPKSDQETVDSLQAKLAADRMAHETARVREYFAKIEKLQGEMDANRAACAPFNAEYDARPWQRFFQVEGGHIHSGIWCAGGSIRSSTRRGWCPQLSDKDEAAAVAELGPLLCTKCFPSAPVEWTRGLDKPVDPNACTGQGKYANKIVWYASPRGECPECGGTVGVTSLGKVRKHKIEK